MPPFSDDPSLAPLGARLRAGAGPCPFVIAREDRPRFAVAHFDGGRDAVYVLVSRAASEAGTTPPDRVTIGYAPHVPGTDLIYDLAAEGMQGKARPFECRLAGARSRLYAILPVQIEAIAVAVQSDPAGRVLRVEFHDAAGERLQAVLPFRLSARTKDGLLHEAGCFVTEPDGQFRSHPTLLADALARTEIVVRSQLTGTEHAVQI